MWLNLYILNRKYLSSPHPLLITPLWNGSPVDKQCRVERKIRPLSITIRVTAWRHDAKLVQSERNVVDTESLKVDPFISRRQRRKEHRLKTSHTASIDVVSIVYTVW